MPRQDLRPEIPPQLAFVEYHLPIAKSGEFTLTFKQELKVSYPPMPRLVLADKVLARFEKSATLVVQGERFALKPAEIAAVFPPPGSLGDHANVLPHLVLTRSTLPWEREAQAGSAEVPWLALLVLDEEEIIPSAGKAQAHTLPLSDLLAANTDLGWPGVTLEQGQAADMKVNVVDIDADAIDDIMPTATELRYLTHVRQGLDAHDQPQGEELAIVIANRLPKPGVTSVVHLVSLENRYLKGAFVTVSPAPPSYRFISLKSWRFSCLPAQADFAGLLQKLAKGPQAANGNSLRLPPATGAGSSLLEPYYSQGYVLLRHFMRGGDKSVSLYRGPLLPVTPADNRVTVVGEVQFPVMAADELLGFHEDIGVFDTSYAAAWELGRLLALRSKTFATGLYNWKRNHAQQVWQLEQAEQRPHLALQQEQPGQPQLPASLESWLSELSLLKGVPFHYLVADEQMLPVESIRFFRIDPRWMASLLDGAFSLGRLTARDYQREQVGRQHVPPLHEEVISGVLLRSAVVSGWPGLLVDGYADSQGKALPLWRFERLAPDVLLCLFQGELQQLDIHQKAELLHFGFDHEQTPGAGMRKTLRDANGKLLPGQSIPLEGANTSLYRVKSKRVLNMAELYKQIAGLWSGGEFTPAQFAMVMTEGIERVRFVAE